MPEHDCADAVSGVCLDCSNGGLRGAEALAPAALLGLAQRLHASACRRHPEPPPRPAVMALAGERSPAGAAPSPFGAACADHDGPGRPGGRAAGLGQRAHGAHGHPSFRPPAQAARLAPALLHAEPRRMTRMPADPGHRALRRRHALLAEPPRCTGASGPTGLRCVRRSIGSLRDRVPRRASRGASRARSSVRGASATHWCGARAAPK
jgi:hypothetical protein